MKRTLKTLLLFILLPVLLLVVLTIGYLVRDPFKVLYHYEDDSVYTLNLNRDFVSTELFIKHYPSEHYNSFVFGSSRAIGYNPDTWKKYLDVGDRPFMFDASSENIYGIYYKLKLLDSYNVSIKNVLILADATKYFFKDYKDENSYLKRNHPATLGNSWIDWVEFEKAHFDAYLKPRFLISYYGYELFGIDNKYTQLHRLRTNMQIQLPSNRLIAAGFEEYLIQKPQYFESDYFYQRPDNLLYLDPQIDEKTTTLLYEIKRIFDKHNTDYKIIINPMYNQIKLDLKDMTLLNDVFGTEKVYDFSGKNHFTESKYNYYEIYHFRPIVGDSIMKVLYQDIE